MGYHSAAEIVAFVTDTLNPVGKFEGGTILLIQMADQYIIPYNFIFYFNLIYKGILYSQVVIIY